MEVLDKLREQFIAETAKRGPMPLYDAQVTAVDTDAYTCDILLDGILPIPEVRLRAVISESQSVDVLPVVGSQVVVGKMGDDDYLVVACDKITSYRITVGTAVFTIDTTGTLISNGEETLKKVLTDFVNAVITIAAPKDMATLSGLILRINTLLK